jgi:hypothetical protein
MSDVVATVAAAPAYAEASAFSVVSPPMMNAAARKSTIAHTAMGTEVMSFI